MHEHVDVIIVGAGLSGVGAAHHLQERCPERSYLILEARQAMGGTWDLFRYPGIRSDSDMHTLGYNFRPWTKAKAIADGPSIREYIEDTAKDGGIDRHIRFGHRVTGVAWSTPDARWTVTTDGPDGAAQFTCNFLHMCSGYYDYERGHAPHFAGQETFEGRIVHPQFWPEDLDYSGKNVVVIGSGATAVTLVPEMAKSAATVTMLQRSPTYVVSRPGQDALANWLRAAGQDGLWHDAVEERADGHAVLPHDAQEPGEGEAEAARSGARAAGAGL
jgi:cation diffusion facilitator CzcD-associated flavoprotein CzcO